MFASKFELMAEDDDDEDFFNIYDNGHWEWNQNTNSLEFISDLPPEIIEVTNMNLKAPTGNIEFRDDVDLIEQIRFRRRYQRKLLGGEKDIVTLQDVKDIALFTAPTSILSAGLIDLLHAHTTERFIRALIFYCQYYLQISEEMQNRLFEREKKIRTPNCEIIEQEYRDNLSDLRLLMAKEYCTILVGGGGTRKHHHMGFHKKAKSLSYKDARLIETFIRVCVQIVWLALGRLNFNQIELEVQRIFKSEIFNPVEQRLKTGYMSKMTKDEISVLFGNCVGKHTKLRTLSPMMNEVFCHRLIDYRLMGLGIIKCPEMSARLRYMLRVVAAPEESFQSLNITLGIIGMNRSVFDTMLVPLCTKPKTGRQSLSANKSTRSFSSASSKTNPEKVYKDISLPSDTTTESSRPPSFPCPYEEPRPCSEVQRKRWQERLLRLIRIASKLTHKSQDTRFVKH